MHIQCIDLINRHRLRGCDGPRATTGKRRSTCEFDKSVISRHSNYSTKITSQYDSGEEASVFATQQQARFECSPSHCHKIFWAIISHWICTKDGNKLLLHIFYGIKIFFFSLENKFKNVLVKVPANLLISMKKTKRFWLASSFQLLWIQTLGTVYAWMYPLQINVFIHFGNFIWRRFGDKHFVSLK